MDETETDTDRPIRQRPNLAGADPSEAEFAAQLESSSEHDDPGSLSGISDTAVAAVKQATAVTVSASQQAIRTVGSAGTSAARAIGSGAIAASEATASAAQTVTDKGKQVIAAGASAAHSAGVGAANAASAGWRATGTSARWVFGTTGAASAQLFSSAQALIASDLSSAVNEVVAAAVKGAPTIYDRAMDAVFNATGIGGMYHRLFDGGHTIFGAFQAAHNASPDDSLLQETLGAIQGLLRDVSTPRGLPLATWDKETFDAVASSLDSTFGIPKKWLYDLNTYDAADVLGGTVGAVSVIFGWNRADTEAFSQIAASMALSAALSTNPVLMPIAVVALGRAFHKAKAADDYSDLADGAFKGALVSGTSLGAIALVGVAGGPAGVAMLTGITAGALMGKLTRDVELSEDLDGVRQAVCQFVKDEACTVMGQIASQAVTVGDGAANLASRAGSAVAQAANAAADTVGRQASQAGRAVAVGTASAGSATAGAAAAAGRVTADAARATGRAGAAATTAAHSAVESAARRAKALVDRNDSEDPEAGQ